MSFITLASHTRCVVQIDLDTSDTVSLHCVSCDEPLLSFTEEKGL